MGAYDVQNQAISAIPVIPSNTINIPAPGIKSSGTVTAGTGVPNMTAGAGTFLTDGVQKGDIIYNVTGIIKIDSIDFEIAYNGRGELLPIHAVFSGVKYKWIKGGFVIPTKNKQRGSLNSYGDLKMIDKNNIV